MLASGGGGTLLSLGYWLQGFGVILCLLGSIRAIPGIRPPAGPTLRCASQNDSAAAPSHECSHLLAVDPTPAPVAGGPRTRRCAAPRASATPGTVRLHGRKPKDRMPRTCPLAREACNVVERHRPFGWGAGRL